MYVLCQMTGSNTPRFAVPLPGSAVNCLCAFTERQVSTCLFTKVPLQKVRLQNVRLPENGLQNVNVCLQNIQRGKSYKMFVFYFDILFIQKVLEMPSSYLN